MAVYDGSFAVFKGKSVARFTVIDPKIEDNTAKPGCVLVEVAPASGERKYDWESKQVFGLTPLECTTLAMNARRFVNGATGDVVFFHDPDAGSKKDTGPVKKLTFKKDKEGDVTTFIAIDKISVPMNLGEIYHLAVLLEAAAPYILAWPKFEG